MKIDNRSRYKPYPRYKDSGVEWLGKIPDGWEIEPLKFGVRMNTDVLDEDTRPDFAFRYADISSITPDGKIGETESTTFEKAPSRARRKVKVGDTIVSTVRTYLKAIAAIRSDADDLIVSTGFAVLRPSNGFQPDFLWRLIQSEPFVQDVVAHSEGVGYPAISPTKLGVLRAWRPPLNQQRAIAEFLDRETAKIDNLIVQKERLIELLEEKRSALITHAVTRGLRPDAPLRDSGIEWLGQIPAHWQLKQLGHEIDLLTGFPFKSELFSFAEGIKLVRGDNVTSGELRWEEKTRYWNYSVEDFTIFLLKANDVLIGMDGSKVGKNYAIIKESDLPLLLVQRVARLRVKRGLVASFLFHLISSDLFRTWVELVKTDPAVPHISPHDIRSFPVAFPPVEEQNKIADYVNTKTAELRTLMAAIQNAISQLQEYRAALITAAVTGKIDVRNEIKVAA